MATLRITSDGDPYPAKAGGDSTGQIIPPVNDGVTARAFLDGSTIQDQAHDFTIKYRAGSNTSDPENVSLTSPIGITTNGVVIYSSGSSNSTLPLSTVSAPNNFTWNTVALPDEYRPDLCGGRPETGGEYRYRSGAFYTHGMVGNSAFASSNNYYNLNSFGIEKMRHTDGHSKIIGFAFDGYPIYGPYGYTDATDTTSNVIQMTSSYRTKLTEAGGRGFTYANKEAGSFIEDFEYVATLGTLDQHNGRFCKTPDYATGTYAYFLTFSDVQLNNPAYPYIIGPSTREQRSVQ